MDTLLISPDSMSQHISGMARFRVKVIINCTSNKNIKNKYASNFKYLTIPYDKDISQDILDSKFSNILKNINSNSKILVHSDIPSRSWFLCALIAMKYMDVKLKDIIEKKFNTTNQSIYTYTDDELNKLILIEKNIFGVNSYTLNQNKYENVMVNFKDLSKSENITETNTPTISYPINDSNNCHNTIRPPDPIISTRLVDNYNYDINSDSDSSNISNNLYEENNIYREASTFTPLPENYIDKLDNDVKKVISVIGNHNNQEYVRDLLLTGMTVESVINMFF